MNKYPNLELIEYKFKQFAFSKCKDILKDACFPIFKVNVFRQTWATTATGFNLKHGFAGQAFTNEYTTVIEMCWSLLDTNENKRNWHDCKDVIYGVFFGNEFAYMVINPKDIFFDDLKNEKMLSQREAIAAYGCLDGDT